MLNDDLVEILLVEDNPNDLELTMRAFKKNNLCNQIHVAHDGEEAIQFIFQKDYDKPGSQTQRLRLILLDLKLPKIDGIEILKKLKASSSTSHIPVVVLTSSKEDKDLIETYKLGVNSYIIKPVDFHKFTEAVNEIGMYWLLLNQVPSELA